MLEIFISVYYLVKSYCLVLQLLLLDFLRIFTEYHSFHLILLIGSTNEKIGHTVCTVKLHHTNSIIGLIDLIYIIDIRC
jgi:hypothetical protein